MYKLNCANASSFLKTIDPETFQSCVTSPPYYGKRRYLPEGHPDSGLEIGLEETVDLYIKGMVEVFSQVKRVLKNDGVLMVVIGDSYASFRDGKCVPESKTNNQRGMPTYNARNRSASTFEGTDIKHKDLLGIPWTLGFALRADGWYLRSDSIWMKNQFRPESVKDRPSTSHEYIFVLSKSEKYFFDKEHFQKTILTVNPKGYKGHSAAFPQELVRPLVLSSSKEGDWILDPFNGSGSVGEGALAYNRHYWGIDLNPDYAKLSDERLKEVQIRFM